MACRSRSRIDLLDLTPDVDVEVRHYTQPAPQPCLLLAVIVANQQPHLQVLLTQIINQEPLISEGKRPALRQLIERLIAKLTEQQHSQFDLLKVCSCRGGQVAISSHVQPPVTAASTCGCTLLCGLPDSCPPVLS